jgi:anti-anti-sigma factor
MNISEEAFDQTTVIRLSGRLDAATAPIVHERLDAVVDRGVDTLVLDLDGVGFMSSVGLRVLISTAKRLRPLGSLRLFGLTPTVRDVFDVSGVSVIFPVFEDEASALSG